MMREIAGTGRQTLHRYIDPALHTMWAVSTARSIRMPLCECVAMTTCCKYARTDGQVKNIMRPAAYRTVDSRGTHLKFLMPCPTVGGGALSDTAIRPSVCPMEQLLRL